MKEIGIQKNIGNLESLISYCKSYNEKYNPSNPDITLVGLNQMLSELREKVSTESKLKNQFMDATNERAQIFKNLDIFSTQVMNALKSSGAPAAKIEDADAHNKKIHGTPAKSKGKKKDEMEIKDPEIKPEEQSEEEIKKEETKENNSISTSQQSYDNLLGHFSKLITVIKTESRYNPNEEEYSVAGLEEKLGKMQTYNEALKESQSKWADALIARNKAFNDEEKGLIHIAQLVKAHVKYVFTATSQEYKHISKLAFRKISER